MLLMCVTLHAQTTRDNSGRNDSLKLYDLQEVVVTATRVPQELINIPQRINVLPLFRLKANPALSVDDVLNQVSGINLRRPSGILSKNTLVSVRGMGNEQGRTLILIDGVPVNKSSTGNVNLNRISPAMLERIEVVKGPGSSLYGGNAMGGVVNLISRLPIEPFEGKAAFTWGEMGTYATNATLAGNFDFLYYSLNGFYQKSNGYNTTPEEERTEKDIKSFLDEYALNGTVGLALNPNHRFELNVRYYDGTRGNGIRYFYADPQQGQLDMTNRFKEQDYRFTYRGNNGKTHWILSAFFGKENYVETKSKGRDIYDVDCLRKDWNIWLNGYNATIENNLISAGMEVKGGFVDGRDIYRTSTDEVIDKGKSFLYAVWLQDEITVLDGKLKIAPSLRFDVAKIYDGGFFIEDPTSITEVYEPYTGKLNNEVWTALSPKLSVQYLFNGNNRIYANTGWGFRPGNLEDMVRTGPARGGVTLANTQLKPEHINTTEVGGDLTLFDFITVSPSVYYSRGRDFIYNVNTGNTILMGNREVPLFAKSNIGKVEIWGGEIDVNAALCDELNLFANYTYTDSKILKGAASISGVETNLKGNHLTYVPLMKISAGLTWRNKFFNLNTTYVQYTHQYTDDLNESKLPCYATVDAKLWRDFGKKVSISLNGQNLFNRRINNNGSVSIGRMLFAEVMMRF